MNISMSVCSKIYKASVKIFKKCKKFIFSGLHTGFDEFQEKSHKKEKTPII